MKLAAIAAICVFFAAGAARADSCPEAMEEFSDAVDEAADDESVSAKSRVKALALIMQAQAAYEEGDDDECTAKVEEAMELLTDS
jgi:hypothetical protein